MENLLDDASIRKIFRTAAGAAVLEHYASAAIATRTGDMHKRISDFAADLKEGPIVLDDATKDFLILRMKAWIFERGHHCAVFTEAQKKFAAEYDILGVEEEALISQGLDEYIGPDYSEGFKNSGDKVAFEISKCPC